MATITLTSEEYAALVADRDALRGECDGLRGEVRTLKVEVSLLEERLKAHLRKLFVSVYLSALLPDGQR